MISAKQHNISHFSNKKNPPNSVKSEYFTFRILAERGGNDLSTCFFQLGTDQKKKNKKYPRIETAKIWNLPENRKDPGQFFNPLTVLSLKKDNNNIYCKMEDIQLGY